VERQKKKRKRRKCCSLIENFSAGSTIWMPVVVPVCSQLSSSLSWYFPKSKKKKKAQEHRSLKSLCLLQKPKRKKFQNPRRDDPRKHKPEEENRRENKTHQKEISSKPQNQNKEAYKNPKQRFKKEEKEEKRLKKIKSDNFINIYGNYSLFP